MPHSLYTQKFKNISAPENLEKWQADCAKYTQILRDKFNAKEITAIDIVNSQDDLEQLEKFAEKISSYSKTLVLGVGGSSLGGKTLSALKFQDKIEFLESIDPTTIKNCLSKIDFENTFFLVISKSGETIETICQTLIILEKIEELQIKDFAKRFLFVTESKQNSITKIAQKIGAQTTEHSNKIGGRYSCFSIVGLLPALIAGLDARKIRKGAQIVLEDFLNKDDISNSCATQLSLYEQGFTNNVIMPYIDNLKNFTDWYRQLWAESLGKNNFGSVPINSLGTVDQHSQLQLYLDGPKDKFFTFITQKKHPNDFLIKDLPDCRTLFGNKNLTDIVKIEQETTIEVLNQKNLPIRTFEIDKLDEEVLGGLMMQCFLETILISYVKEINPFDQPAVELRKNLAKTILNK